MRHRDLKQITQDHTVTKQKNHGVNAGRLAIGSVISETGLWSLLVEKVCDAFN